MARPKKIAETLLATDETSKQLQQEEELKETVKNVLDEMPEEPVKGEQEAKPFISDTEKEQLIKLSEFLNRVHLRSNNVPERTAIQSWRELITTLATRS